MGVTQTAHKTNTQKKKNSIYFSLWKIISIVIFKVFNLYQESKDLVSGIFFPGNDKL